MELSRRGVLALFGGLSAAAILAACGDGDGVPGAGASGPPRKGGVLRVGALGRASAVTRDPHGVQTNESDFLILSLMYDALTVPGVGNVVPRLAKSWSSSEDLKTWRFEIADGATFHDGSPVTAEDVVWSLKRLRDTDAGATRLPGVSSENISADGPTTVVLVSDYPNSELPMQARLATMILKKDTVEVAGSPGSGPFKLDWFKDGNARLVRNDAWHGGEVYLDAIEVTMFDSTQAMAQAVLGGQIDLASNVGAVAARTAETRPDIAVVRRPDDMAMPLVMRTADGPFADVRVREAMRLAVDREAMVAQVLSGFGTVANDILGTGDARYAADIPQRARDLARASALLDEAGFDKTKTYRLLTTEDISGLAESATLLATQLAEAGIQIEVVVQESGAFWDESWLKADLYTSYWGTNDSVLFFAGKVLVSDTGFNETAFHDPDFDAAYRKAVSATAGPEQDAAVREVQRIQYERSGYLLWGMAEGIDLAVAGVRGLPELGGYARVQLERAWFAA